MDRQPPRAIGDEIDLYVRTYYSLLRSSSDVHVRAFEEAHMYSSSSLHEGAKSAVPDVAAFAYSAARLPSIMPWVNKIVMGQSHEQFEAAGLDVLNWQRVRTRGRRRPLRWNESGVLGAFVTSTSDIDDLVPIVTAYQIEWNKIHGLLQRAHFSEMLAKFIDDPSTLDHAQEIALAESLSAALGLEPDQIRRLCDALGPKWLEALSVITLRSCHLSVRLLSGSFSQYQRAAQRWWGSIERKYLREAEPKRPPVYFVSSNTHALVNLIGGYARTHQKEIIEFADQHNPENLKPALNDAIARGDKHEVANLTYYLLRAFLHVDMKADAKGLQDRMREVQAFDAESGISTIDSPGKIDVGAQVIRLSSIMPERLDDRLHVSGLERLKESDAVIINIDYPLGLAAYHHLSRLAQGVGDIRGVYVMGKAATLNGKVGDIMISSVVYDEHSHNTYLYRNAFNASHVEGYTTMGSVFDNQKALTVRGPFLQNRTYMSSFYRDGYTVLEMEAGPYLSAIFELVSPNRHPDDEVVHLSNLTHFDVGILHYASDTPYSRRQTLLSKSLSYFGVDSTYACAIAILKRIIELELSESKSRY